MTNSSELFLVLSNLAVIPPFLYALVLAELSSAVLLVITAIISFFYHLCQTGIFCVIDNSSDFSVLQFADEYFVFIVILWFVAYFFGMTTRTIPLELTISFIWIAQAVGFLPLVSDSENFIYYEIAFVGFMIIGSFIWTFSTKRIIDWESLGIGLGFIAAGSILFIVGGDPGNEGYNWVHGTWHFMLFFAVVFILDTKYGNIKRFFACKRLKTRWNSYINYSKKIKK